MRVMAPKMIGIRRLGRIFGWSAAKTKKVLNSLKMCHPDGTPSGVWASNVSPQFITCQYTGSAVVKYLWPEADVLETLQDAGYKKLSMEEKGFYIGSWYLVDKPMQIMTGIVHEKSRTSDEESARLQSLLIHCSSLCIRWMQYARSNIRSISREIESIYHEFLNTKVGNNRVGDIIQEDARTKTTLQELSNFLRRQRFRGLSKGVMNWTKG